VALRLEKKFRTKLFFTFIKEITMIDTNHPKYKKAIYHSARRAMLENELIVRKFVEEYVPQNYDEAKLDELNFLLDDILDMDLFEVVMAQSPAEKFKDNYNIEILKDIEKFAHIHNAEFARKK